VHKKEKRGTGKKSWEAGSVTKKDQIETSVIRRVCKEGKRGGKGGGGATEKEMDKKATSIEKRLPSAKKKKEGQERGEKRPGKYKPSGAREIQKSKKIKKVCKGRVLPSQKKTARGGTKGKKIGTGKKSLLKRPNC